jgi:hypothetical protein
MEAEVLANVAGVNPHRAADLLIELLHHDHDAVEILVQSFCKEVAALDVIAGASELPVADDRQISDEFKAVPLPLPVSVTDPVPSTLVVTVYSEVSVSTVLFLMTRISLFVRILNVNANGPRPVLPVN